MPDGRTLTRIIASLVGALGVAALSLDRYDVVKLSRRSVVAAIAAVALGTAGAAIAEVFLDRSGVRRLKFERDVRQQLRSAIASTATRQKDAWEHVRASLYRIERSSWRPWTQRKLVRRLDEHLLLAPAPSEPKWKRGEGVVGKCWATQGDQHGAQSGEELFAVAIRNGGGVLGVVSLAAPTEHAADIASEAAHQAAWLAAAALSRILSNYGVPAR